jgi:uncharacterized protein
MSIEQRLNDDAESALRAGHKADLLAYRTLLAQIKDERIKLRPKRELTEDDVLHVLNHALKKRKEAIELYRKGNREDLVEKEIHEIKIIEKYLPEMIAEEALLKKVDETIKKINATSLQNLGRVMGSVMKDLKGRVDGQLVQNIVREKLSQL